MKYFVQFPCLGSDGIFVLDGRNSLNTMINDAINRAHQLRKVKQFKSFEIHRGDLKRSTVIYSGNIA